MYVYKVEVMKGLYHNVIQAGHKLAVVVDRMWMPFHPSEMTLADWYRNIGARNVSRFLKKGSPLEFRLCHTDWLAFLQG